MTNYLSQKIKLISFFSIVMVVVLHSYNIDIKQNGVVLALPKDFNWFLQTFFSFGVTRIAVPIFFIISGFLFFKDAQNEYPRFNQKILKRFKTLVIPYFFWVLFGNKFKRTAKNIPPLPVVLKPSECFVYSFMVVPGANHQSSKPPIAPKLVPHVRRLLVPPLAPMPP